MSYGIKAIFRTVQGEGANAGRSAVFVRFSGCDVWSGLEKDREAGATRGACALWCDTDFRGHDGHRGAVYDNAVDVARAVEAEWGPLLAGRFVVLSGGEPSLQYDVALYRALKQRGFYIAMETNGHRLLQAPVDWLTVSPKPPGTFVTANTYSEIKVVVPSFDPRDYDHLVNPAVRRFVQPRDDGEASANAENVEHALAFVHAHPHWRLSVQTHKTLGVP